MRVINFYKTQDDYGCFSNFSRHSVKMPRDEQILIWPTSEHYFQAMKFLDYNLQDEVRLAPTPKAAALMGRDQSRPLRKDWEDIKDDVMLKVVRAKFVQHYDIMMILQSTGNAVLVEHTVNDSYWGDGGDGSGKNMLGKILMIVRDTTIRSEEYLNTL